MKRLLLLILMCMPIMASAQSPGTFDELFTRYQTEQDCTTVILSREMLASMDVGPGIDLMQVISIENNTQSARFVSDVETIIANYIVIMRVGSGNQMVKMVSLANDEGAITELVILTTDSSECVVVRLIGKDIKLEDTGSIINL